MALFNKIVKGLGAALKFENRVLAVSIPKKISFEGQFYRYPIQAPKHDLAKAGFL